MTLPRNGTGRGSWSNPASLRASPSRRRRCRTQERKARALMRSTTPTETMLAGCPATPPGWRVQRGPMRRERCPGRWIARAGVRDARSPTTRATRPRRPRVASARQQQPARSHRPRHVDSGDSTLVACARRPDARYRVLWPGSRGSACRCHAGQRTPRDGRCQRPRGLCPRAKRAAHARCPDVPLRGMPARRRDCDRSTGAIHVQGPARGGRASPSRYRLVRDPSPRCAGPGSAALASMHACPPCGSTRKLPQVVIQYKCTWMQSADDLPWLQYAPCGRSAPMDETVGVWR